MPPVLVRAVTALALIAAAAGCAPPRTVIDVALATDAPTDRTLTVLATVHAGDGTAGDGGTHAFDFGPSEAHTLPGDFWIRPGLAANDSTVTLELSVVVGPGTHGEPAASFHRVATWSFVPDTVEHRSVFLTLGCVVSAAGCSRTDVPCTVAELCEERGTTCGDNATCQSVGPPALDAGVDAMPDAVGVDANPPDAGDFDAPPDVPPDVPTALGTPGGPCDPTVRSCPDGYGCFGFTSPAGSRCERCGRPGERACGATPCSPGPTATDASGASICYDPTRMMGSPGGLCDTDGTCRSGQCFAARTASGTVNICLECGADGEFCCCPGGTSCACDTGRQCAMSAGPTVCY